MRCPGVARSWDGGAGSNPPPSTPPHFLSRVLVSIASSPPTSTLPNTFAAPSPPLVPFACGLRPAAFECVRWVCWEDGGRLSHSTPMEKRWGRGRPSISMSTSSAPFTAVRFPTTHRCRFPLAACVACANIATHASPSFPRSTYLFRHTHIYTHTQASDARRSPLTQLLSLLLILCFAGHVSR
jgi:hypothetical protein